MKLITNIYPPLLSLSSILLEQSKDLKEIKAAVAYCKDYKLFEYCKQHKIKLDYYGRLDASINLNLENLKDVLTDGISIHIIGGTKFHPKVIWCYNYGAYIGSANLTKSAWKENIECGLWLTQKELEDNHLIDPLSNFFTFIQKKSKLLSSISDQDISELNRHKQNNPQNSEASLIIKRIIGNFDGCSKKEYSNIKPQSKKKRQTLNPDQNFDEKKVENFKFWNELVRKELEKRKEMTGLEMSKPLTKYRNCIAINLKPIEYKNHIRAFRIGKSPSHEIGVYYGFKNEDKEDYDKLKKEKMFHLIKNKSFGTGRIESWPMTFNFIKDGGVKEEDKQWIVDRIIDLLRALRNPEKNFQSDQQISTNKTYRKGSGWNDETEMMCLLIFKILKDENFPRGKQAKLCKKMASIPQIGLKEKSINSKISDYKKASSYKSFSHDSTNTKYIYEKYHKLSIRKLEKKIQSLTKYEFNGFSKKG